MRRIPDRVVSLFARSVIGGLVCLAIVRIGRTDDRPKAVVHKVLDAWNHRKMNIQSFVYRFELEWSLPVGSRNHLAPAYMRKDGRNVPSKDVVLRSSWVCAFSSGKMMVSQRGDGWSDETDSVRAKETKASFGGSESKTLIMSPTDPFGIGELITGDDPSDLIVNHVNLIPLWLSVCPLEQLRRMGCKTDDIECDPLPVSYDGHDGVQLRFSSGVASRTTFVTVDPSRDSIPMRLLRERTGHRTSDLAIHYVEDARIGWRVSSWERTEFSSSGKVTDSRSCKVIECSINDPVAGELLTFQFPEGTNVLEQNGDTRKYFVALANGKRHYITEHEFGRLPRSPIDASKRGNSTRIVAAIFASLLTLGVFLLWLRRK